MAKWADYGISEVRYDLAENHIVAVMCHEDTGDSIAAGVEITRATVVTRIESGKTFVTIRKNSEGKYVRGEDVRVVEIDGAKYIRTDANKTKADNLGTLPRF